MNFNVNTNITLMPRAHAVARVPRFHDSLPRRFGTSCALGDVVQIEGSSVKLVVAARLWTLGQTHETLEVMLDLVEDPAPLREAS